jgi:hypothetical protein
VDGDAVTGAAGSGVWVNSPDRVDTKAHRCEAQEALTFGGIGIVCSDAERQFVGGASHLSRHLQALGRRHPAPRFYLAVLDLNGGVSR